MSKGIAVHILITLVFILTYWWVTDGIEVSPEIKIWVAILFFFIHIFSSAPISDFGDKNNLYKQKL